MLPQKRLLTIEELDSQVAFELPSREMMLVTVIITDVLNNLSINVEIKNNNLAVQVCAVVALLGTLLGRDLTCTIQQ